MSSSGLVFQFDLTMKHFEHNRKPFILISSVFSQLIHCHDTSDDYKWIHVWTIVDGFFYAVWPNVIFMVLNKNRNGIPRKVRI